MKIRSESEMKAAGSSAAFFVAKSGNKDKKAVVIGLFGDLGAGKTVFSKGFLSFFGIKRVVSPTFSVMKKYPIKGFSWKNIYHLDCYRLKDPSELIVLGFEKIVADPENIILIEWPEMAGSFFKGLSVRISHGKEEIERNIFLPARLKG